MSFATTSAVSKPGHVRNAAESGSKFRAISGSATNVIQAPKLESRIMRYELSDYGWTAVKPTLPNKPRSVRRVNDRRVLNGIFWVLRSGAPWRDLPENHGPHTTRHGNDDGIVVRARRKLLKRINVIWVVQSPLQKYFASPVGQIISTHSRHPTPPEGRIAIVTDAGCGCGGRGSVLRATGSQGG
jgi:transposase